MLLKDKVAVVYPTTVNAEVSRRHCSTLGLGGRGYPRPRC